MSFTQVNSETFALWCDVYKEKMRRMKEEMLTERDLKLTGRQLFEGKKMIIDDIKIDEDEDDEEFKDDEFGDDQDDEDEEDPLFYDQALYDAQALEEDVDFE